MNKKLRLGKKTEDHYSYSTSITLRKDLGTQLESYVEEREMRDSVKQEIGKISDAVKKFKNEKKKNNLLYYFQIGKNLKFLEKKIYKNVELWSVFRFIYEWVPNLLPHITDVELGAKHIAIMYYLGKVDRKDLPKATWWQWYEFVKFPKLFTSEKLYKKILDSAKTKKGSIRTKIPDELKN